MFYSGYFQDLSYEISVISQKREHYIAIKLLYELQAALSQFMLIKKRNAGEIKGIIR